MELWFTEYQTKNVGISLKVKSTIYKEETEYQKMSLLETEQFGKTLILDGAIQTTEKDEFVYHEMITHVPLFTHPNPEKVLVIGGGDGGTVREILKHTSVEKAVLVEIDKRVVEISKEFLPEISCALDDKRLEIKVTDGIKYVNDHKNEFDVIIVDSTDPVGPAVGLFENRFYKSVHEALKEDGIFVAQTESPFFYESLINKITNDISSVFKICRLYTCAIPSYPGGFWSFTMGSKMNDPYTVDVSKIPDLDTKYYNAGIHKACFVLPNFVKDMVGY